MLRITPEMRDGQCVLRVEGEVVGAWVEALRDSCDDARGAGGRMLTLDLSDVGFVDRDGVEMLRRLMDAGVALVNCSPFVQTQVGA